jgi:glycerophosphoryl diester phosphodiesterase
VKFLQFLTRAVDAYFAVRPQPAPDAATLARACLVAHRGAHGPGRPENTLRAFDAAREAGVWGIELDLRWSADLEPVILHDGDCARVFGQTCVPALMDKDRLRRQVPQLPFLSEIVERYGKQLHLMLEIKAEPYPEPQRQSERLAELLSGLGSGDDYHVLALDPLLFDRFPWLEPAACVTVSETNVRRLSQLSLQRGYGGFTGHYLLLGRSLHQHHRAAGQKVGVGFPASANSLRREINRGVDWIFTDHALELQSYLNAWQNE